MFFLDKANDKTLGKVKLAKMLFFVDLEAYKRFGHTITDTDYIRMPRGPMPVEFEETLNTMKKQGLIRKGKRNEPHFFPLQHYSSSIFPGVEMELLSEAAAQFVSSQTRLLVWLSHENYAWKYLKHGSYISFALASTNSEEEAKELVSIASKLTPTEIIEESPELSASLEKGKRGRIRGKLCPVDSIFD